MSRSRRKLYSYHRNAGGGSIRWFKRAHSQKARKLYRIAIRKGNYDKAEEQLPFDEWASPRDGKFYIPSVKDALHRQKLLRK